MLARCLMCRCHPFGLRTNSNQQYISIWSLLMCRFAHVPLAPAPLSQEEEEGMRRSACTIRHVYYKTITSSPPPHPQPSSSKPPSRPPRPPLHPMPVRASSPFVRIKYVGDSLGKPLGRAMLPAALNFAQLNAQGSDQNRIFRATVFLPRTTIA
jgi:hypothetical protein